MNGSPEALLDHPAVTPAAPWCRKLDLFELALVLALQPAGLGRPMNRGELLAHVSSVGGSTPLGKTYFQKVNRAISKLVSWKIVRASGRGKTQVFALAPTGFASLLLNVRHLETDPTDDPSEFELKLVVVAAWSLMVDQLSDIKLKPPAVAGVSTFFGEVEAITIGGRLVVTPELVEDTFNVLRHVERQRARVEAMAAQAEAAAASIAESSDVFAQIDVGQLLDGEAAKDATLAKLIETAAEVIGARLPVLSARARALRYRRYLDYLRDLGGLYGEGLKGVDLAAYRQLRRPVR